MITGDHKTTALAIGEKVGIVDNIEQVFDCRELDNMDEETAEQKIVASKIFARAVPENKYQILETLKKHNIVAMTGDGVNDVPALRGAHVGIAMGSGAEMAHSAGDIILLDDNFKNIVVAIREGRVILTNIRRTMSYLLSTNLGEALTMLAGLLLANALPVSPIQILWINIVTDTLMVIPLGLEPAEENVLKQKPQLINAPLLSRNLVVRMFLTAMVMSTLTISIFMITRPMFGLEIAEVFAFISLVVAQWANAISFRSFSQSFIKRSKVPNWPLFICLMIAIFLQVMVLFFWQPLLGIPSDIPIVPLIIVAGISFAIPLATTELHKKLSKNKA
jgi:Ca2+-transporting ATPase